MPDPLLAMGYGRGKPQWLDRWKDSWGNAISVYSCPLRDVPEDLGRCAQSLGHECSELAIHL